ncbi:protein croquemort isoform X2 [Agrilus planipennis]|nr:protein croquemort isoform X2 [Agrilus planipennis]XP_018327457.1 protein croquemort isoform X2 [Agrilus planipennis]XP_018327458.1 protein croquemort isoform X2 [Agrilus planipennis]
MNCCSRKCELSTLYGLSIVFLGLAILTLAGWEKAYNSIIFNALTLTNTSKGYNMWKKTPIPMYLELYLYNWTNADEVIASNFDIKPNFQECGPYVYEEVHTRVNLKWHENGTLTYQQKRTWQFVPELTNGSLEDEIVNVNVIVATVAYNVRHSSFITKAIVNRFLKVMNESLIVTRSARQLLFEGYNDPLLDFASSLNISIPFNKFGWFYGRNNSETYDGVFNIYTGRTDLDLLGMMDLWNHVPHTNIYEGYCDYVNGTTGEVWPPVKHVQKVAVFSPDICSTVWLSYEQDVSMLEVIGRKYISTNFTLDNGVLYPELACFNYGDPVPTGARNVSACKFGAPAFVTLPHFYLADDEYLQNVSGISPNKSEDEFYMILEPNTGIPMAVKAQMQINILLEPISGISLLNSVKSTFMPVLWFRQTATLTGEYAGLVRLLLNLPHIAIYTGYGVLCLGIVILFIGIYVTLASRRKEETEALISETT